MRVRANPGYALLCLGAWGALRLFFALESGEITRRGPDISSVSDPDTFRRYLVMYSMIACFGIGAGLIALGWRILRGQG